MNMKNKEHALNCEGISYKDVLLNHSPDICLGISFVEYGYQADLWIKDDQDAPDVEDDKGDKRTNTYHYSSECRDFSGDYKIQDLIKEFEEKLEVLIDEFRGSK